MEDLENSCFICGQPSPIYYDFAVIENTHGFKGAYFYKKTDATQRIAGIARISLCGDCLNERLDRFIQENTNANGKPKFGKKRIVVTCQILRRKLNEEGYKKSSDMQILFFASLSPFQEVVTFNDKKQPLDRLDIPMGEWAVQRYAHLGDEYLARVPDKVKERITSKDIEAKFSLITMDGDAHSDSEPFTEAIEPVLSGGYLSLFFVEYLTQLGGPYRLAQELREPAEDLMNYYVALFAGLRRAKPKAHDVMFGRVARSKKFPWEKSEWEQV